MLVCTTCGKEWPDEYRLCPNDGSSLRDSSAETDIVGSVIADRYHIKAKLGEGGMGAVYLAEHVRMGQEVAVKVASRALASDPESIARFTREARNAARIKHPNVCVVHDFGETETGLVYLAMEFVEGGSLSDLLRRKGAIPLDQAVTIITQCCDALQAAHEMDIVHRDIKPDNIMISERPDGTVVVKLVDFGIAKAFTPEEGQTVTKTGYIVGTPDYMSPEQVSGSPLDGRSDVYSLALVLFRMLTDRLPFEADTPQELLMSRLTSPPLRLAEVLPHTALPPQLQGVFDRALERDRELRYATAGEFRRAVAAAVSGTESVTVKTGPSIEQAAAAETEVFDTTGRTVLLAETPTPDTPRPAKPVEAERRRSVFRFATFGVVGVFAIGVIWVITGSGLLDTTVGPAGPATSTAGEVPEGAADENATTDTARPTSPQTHTDREGRGSDPATQSEPATADTTPRETVITVPVSQRRREEANRALEWRGIDHRLTEAELRGIWGTRAKLWIVGYNGTVLHHDGTQWDHGISLERTRALGPALESSSLEAVWGSAADDVWAVGMRILHYDGDQWDDATPDFDFEWLKSIWGSGPRDIWTVGDRGSMLHYDGDAWADASGTVTTEDLTGVWGSSVSDVWAVDEGGAIYHYDGSSWTDATPDLEREWLEDVWGSGPNDVWAVGHGGAMLHYDGSSWSDVAPLTRRGGDVVRLINSDIYAITGTGPGNIWIITQGPIYRYDGNEWTQQTSNNDVLRLRDVWAVGPEDVWAIGWWGTLMHLSR